MTEMLFILVFNSFTGAMQQYENELFDVSQLNHQNHLLNTTIIILFLQQN